MIAKIEYDLNNNPIRIQFTNANVTKYVYSATGEKLRVIYQTSVYPEDAEIVKIGKTKELTEEETNCTETVDYLLGGSLVMRNGKIDKVLFEGGYAQASAVSNTTKDKFAFYYYNQDHLGNNREVVDAKGVVQQVTNYYPFGAPYADATAIMGAAVQPYKYNGKELDLMHGLNTYDYGARQHDPILARWDKIDPLCEKYYSTNPYAYCMNNPVRFIDPDGRYITCGADNGNQYIYYQGQWHHYEISSKDRTEIKIGDVYNAKKGSFMDQVLKSINKMYESASSEVRTVIREVANSTADHNIYDNSGSNEGSACVSRGNGGDDQIQMNLAFDNKSTTNTFTFYEVFGHEIKHAYDRDCGIFSGNSEDFTHIDNSEFSTVYFENLLRKQEKDRPQRTTYGGVSIYDERIPQEYRGVTIYTPERKKVSKWIK